MKISKLSNILIICLLLSGGLKTAEAGGGARPNFLAESQKLLEESLNNIKVVASGGSLSAENQRLIDQAVRNLSQLDSDIASHVVHFQSSGLEISCSFARGFITYAAIKFGSIIENLTCEGTQISGTFTVANKINPTFYWPENGTSFLSSKQAEEYARLVNEFALVVTAGQTRHVGTVEQREIVGYQRYGYKLYFGG